MYKKFYSLLLFLGLAVGFTSCDEADVEPATDTATLTSFATLATSVTSNSVASTDSTTTKPKCVGKKSKLTEIDVATLSASITTYIAENYAGATTERAGTTSQGGYVVQLVLADGTKTALLFDASGAFVAVDTHQHGTEVAVADLPAAITDYVDATYSGSSILKAKKDANGNFIVVVQKTDSTMVGLAFTAEGTFTSELVLQGEFGCGKGGKRGSKHGK